MKKIYSITEYILVFVFLFLTCLFINRAIVIKGLYMDDLFYWSWFPETDFYSFALKIYEDNTKYRPFFDMIQYIEYCIVGHNVFLFAFINKFLNSLVALFIYFFVKKLNAKKLIAILVSVLYLASHFAYYQIGQVFGLLETESQFFALLLLYLCLRLTGVIDLYKKNETTKLLVLSMITFFIVVFVHERYLCLIPLVIISILCLKSNDGVKNAHKYKLFALIAFFIEIVAIVIIRFITIGKVIPAGTGGTYVTETFSFMTCLRQCIEQVAFIFGVNIGPEHLVGIDFMNLPHRGIKFLVLLSVMIIFVILIIYLVVKIRSKETKTYRKSFIGDILFLVFIAFCIGGSSVSIRVEMRFVYVSFTASLLYLSYMCGDIMSIFNIKEKYNQLIYVIILNVLFILFATIRLPVELTYRKYFNKIYCYIDQSRMNSLYDNTIKKYGLDEVLNKRTVYILKNDYGLTNFYCEAFYQIYDDDYKGTKIQILNDITELPKVATKENSIILLEDFANNGYIEAPIW